MLATITRESIDPPVYRVEAVTEDDAVEVAVFSGYEAMERAVLWASSDRYDEWTDSSGEILGKLLETAVSLMKMGEG